MFGGKSLRTMYVGTASKPLSIFGGLFASLGPTDDVPNADGGYIYKITGYNSTNPKALKHGMCGWEACV